MSSRTNTAEELEIIRRDPVMARWVGDHDFKAMAHLRQHLYGAKLGAVPRPATKAKLARSNPAAKPMTLAEIKAGIDEMEGRFARLRAAHVVDAAARAAAAQQATQRAEDRRTIQAAFGIHPARGVTFDGVVQRFG